jgi:hypothetical protein
VVNYMVCGEGTNKWSSRQLGPIGAFQPGPIGAELKFQPGPIVKVETRCDGEEECMVGCQWGLGEVGTGSSRQPGPIGAFQPGPIGAETKFP